MFAASAFVKVNSKGNLRKRLLSDMVIQSCQFAVADDEAFEPLKALILRALEDCL